MKPIKNKDIESYLNDLEDFQKEIILSIREAVLSVDDKVKEGMKWSSIAFFNNKNICGFRVAKLHVTLLFMEGAALSDKHNILQGKGVKARTYKINNVLEVNSEAIAGLIKESLQFGM